MGKKKVLLVIVLLSAKNPISALNLAGNAFLGNLGYGYSYNYSKKEGTGSFDIDLFKCCLYDKDSRFGLDFMPLSFNSLDNWVNFIYVGVFNLDLHYCPIKFGDTVYTNLYATGGLSGIAYPTGLNNNTNNNDFFESTIYNISTGIRLRKIDFDIFFSSNFDIYFEYNFINKNFTLGFSTGFLSPLYIFLGK